jgi:hypothetical protein
MKILLNKLFDFLRINKIKKQPKEDIPNSITFTLEKNKENPTIKINLFNLSEDDCKNYAAMIFNMNFGLYENTIFNILNDISKQDEEVEAFTKNATMYYVFKVKDLEKKILKENPLSYKPIISPTEFQKYAK